MYEIIEVHLKKNRLNVSVTIFPNVYTDERRTQEAKLFSSVIGRKHGIVFVTLHA